MRRLSFVIVCLIGTAAVIGASPGQRAPAPAVSAAVATLLIQARAHLKVSREITDVVSLDVTGTETLLREPHPKVDPYEFKLLLPDSLQLRTGPIVHTLARGAYGRRLVDSARYGGPMVDRMMGDAESQKAAARGMPFHLMRLSLTYLARTPPGMTVSVRDEGIRHFTRVKGRTIAFDNNAQHISIEFVLDPVTKQPLATVSHARSTNGETSSDTEWISILQDYGDVSGVRVPRRIEEWIGANHSRVALTKIEVNGLKPENFTLKMPPAP